MEIMTPEERQRRGRVAWYEEAMPKFWRKFQFDLGVMLEDKSWGGELDECCQRWFGRSEAQMRELAGFEVPADPGLVYVKEIAKSIPAKLEKVGQGDEKAKKRLAQAKWRAKQKLRGEGGGSPLGEREERAQ